MYRISSCPHTDQIFPKFKHHMESSAALFCSILFTKLRACLIGHCWQCRVYISANEPTVPLLCHETLKQHNVSTHYVVFEVFQFPMQILSEIFFFSIKYLPSYGSDNHRNICGSSSYMSVILSYFSKNCNSWVNLIAISNLKFHEQPNADSRGISIVQKDKRKNQFSVSPAGLRTPMTVEHILIPDTFFGVIPAVFRHK
jgi:hypothetical protein